MSTSKLCFIGKTNCANSVEMDSLQLADIAEWQEKHGYSHEAYLTRGYILEMLVRGFVTQSFFRR